MRNTVWNLITGKLFIGDTARQYLHDFKPDIASRHENCPYCKMESKLNGDHFIVHRQALYEHIFWSCPVAGTLRRNILATCTTAQLELPTFNSYHDLFDFIQVNDDLSLQQLMRDDVLYVYIYTLYTFFRESVDMCYSNNAD